MMFRIKVANNQYQDLDATYRGSSVCRPIDPGRKE